MCDTHPLIDCDELNQSQGKEASLDGSLVVLVGGAPGAGKTTLGRALAARLGADSLSVDDLATGARGVTTPASHQGLHVMSEAITGLTSVEYFTKGPIDRLIADSDVQHEATWPAVEAVISSRASWGDPIVIDGWYFRPNMVMRLNQPNVLSFWLVVEHSVLEDRERGQEFYSQSPNPEQMLQNFLGRSYWYNDLIRQETAKLDMPILVQDGSASVDDLCDLVIGQLPE